MAITIWSKVTRTLQPLSHPHVLLSFKICPVKCHMIRPKSLVWRDESSPCQLQMMSSFSSLEKICWNSPQYFENINLFRCQQHPRLHSWISPKKSGLPNSSSGSVTGFSVSRPMPISCSQSGTSGISNGSGSLTTWLEINNASPSITERQNDLSGKKYMPLIRIKVSLLSRVPALISRLKCIAKLFKNLSFISWNPKTFQVLAIREYPRSNAKIHSGIIVEGANRSR